MGLPKELGSFLRIARPHQGNLHLSFAHPNDHSPVHHRVSITAHLPLGELGTDPAQLGLRRPGSKDDEGGDLTLWGNPESLQHSPKGVHAGYPAVSLLILPGGALQPVSSCLNSQEGSRYQQVVPDPPRPGISAELPRASPSPQVLSRQQPAARIPLSRKLSPHPLSSFRHPAF